MSKFCIGDKVIVYGSLDGKMTRRCCEVLNISKHSLEKGVLWVNEYDSGLSFNAWPQQCRKLIPKKRREIWAYEPELELSHSTWHRNPGDSPKWIRFVEAKKTT